MHKLMDLEKIQKELDYYRKFTPVNFAEERLKFFEPIYIFKVSVTVSVTPMV